MRFLLEQIGGTWPRLMLTNTDMKRVCQTQGRSRNVLDAWTAEKPVRRTEARLTVAARLQDKLRLHVD